jgi:hypothetical protein
MIVCSMSKSRRSKVYVHTGMDTLRQSVDIRARVGYLYRDQPA